MGGRAGASSQIRKSLVELGIDFSKIHTTEQERCHRKYDQQLRCVNPRHGNNCSSLGSAKQSDGLRCLPSPDRLLRATRMLVGTLDERGRMLSLYSTLHILELCFSQLPHRYPVRISVTCCTRIRPDCTRSICPSGRLTCFTRNSRGIGRRQPSCST